MNREKLKDFLNQEIDCKKILKYTGKTLATIASPPIGLALLAKNIKAKVSTCGIVGVVLSIFGTIPINYIASNKEIYNSENLKVSNQLASNSNARAVVEFFTSPLAFYLDSHRITLIEENDKIFYTKGDDIINFVNGKYQLNLGIEKKVGGCFSVKEATENIRKYERELGEYLQKGDIKNARKAKENLHDARKTLDITTQLYTQTRDVFQKTVNTMNSELESLAK